MYLNLIDPKRRIIRAPVNPLDKATVISIYPKEVDETKPTIQPGRFILKAGTYEKPAVLIVGPSSWWREIDEEQPLLEIPVSSIQIADSIVRDYCNGILGSNMTDTMPGMFYLPGSLSPVDIVKNFKPQLDQALQKQRNWYQLLVRMADALWARSNGNPLAIGDDMRMAARELGLHERKDWMKEFQMVELDRCHACGSLVNPTYPVCATCKAIVNPARAKELGITFAQ